MDIVDKRGSMSTPEETQRVATPEFVPPPPPDYSKVNLKMCGDRVLIQEWKMSEKIGSIYTPQNMEIFIDKGRIIAIGEEVKNIKVGDVIYKASGLGQTLVDNGETYIFLPERAIIAIDKSFSSEAPQ